jgi:arginine decarboxylase
MTQQPVPLTAASTPLLSALQHWANCDYAPFHTPGHRRGQGSSSPMLGLVGTQALRADLPELPDLDNLFAPQGVIQQAQDLAALTFGADRTWFLANGSTGGVIAAILSTCQPGDQIILPRNVHQSVISGLILAGANPIFMLPEYDPDWDIAHGVRVRTIAQTLQQHPKAKAVLIVSPTYYGVCSDVASIAEITNRYNIPLIVDEAHGAHLRFHPDLPSAALDAGADVVVQSTHKTLSALTQAAMLHLRGDRVQGDRISRSLQLVQSTSPNYLLLASLDAARQQMAITGVQLLSQVLLQVKSVRDRLADIPGIRILASAIKPGFHDHDQTRLTISVVDLGLTGFHADEILTEQLGVICELPSLRHLTFIFSIGTTDADCDRLVSAIVQLAATTHPQDIIPSAPQFFPQPETVITPRDAFFSRSQTVSIDQAIGRISAELICPYPPGIPVLLPGERITPAAIEHLQAVLRSGGLITGVTDPTLRCLEVISD